MPVQAEGERGYHIFYELVQGADAELKQKLGLDTEHFNYLSNGQVEILGRSDAEQFGVTRGCLSRIGLPEATQTDIFTMIAAVLHLGPVQTHTLPPLRAPPRCSPHDAVWPAGVPTACVRSSVSVCVCVW